MNQKYFSPIRTFVSAHYDMGWRIAPAWTVNYVLITYVFVVLHWTSFYGVGTVLLGDLVGVEINVWVFRKFGYPNVNREKKEYQPLRNIRQNIARTWLDVGAGKYPISESALRYDVDPTTNPDVVGSVTRMEFPDESFQTITALEILEHLHRPDLALALAEIKRVLKRGGRLIVSIPNTTPAMAVPQAIVWFVRERTTQRRYLHNQYTHTHIGLIQPAELVKLLESFGFRVLQTRRIMLYDFMVMCEKP